MTDLCDEPEAEAVADASAAAARAADESNPDAYALSASVRLSQSRPAEAAPLLHRACELLAALFRAADGGGDEEDGDEDEEAGEGAAVPAGRRWRGEGGERGARALRVEKVATYLREDGRGGNHPPSRDTLLHPPAAAAA